MNDSQVQIQSLNLRSLETLAGTMVRELPSPLVIGLVGTLGAGKTTFVQALARAAGIDAVDVTSPTFTLLQTHRGAIVIHHLDAYRVADDEEFLQLGVDELFADDDAWTIIEWGDRVAEVLPANTLWIELVQGSDQDTRDVSFRSTGGTWGAAIQRIQAGLGAANQ
ncbi:MAG: tRNA (adenosine(37)-N6)-threonylcarbamoyltransferase complex ATPase subunit type 1 TsaE [Rubripirellula sp.]|nr:tRNA (adenosine(37)-N6)-threonylcarbamoyltransferase complex ATPase subunit type 1 TsaE [Rubripirellula sp.]